MPKFHVIENLIKFNILIRLKIFWKQIKLIKFYKIFKSNWHFIAVFYSNIYALKHVSD